MSRYYKHTDIFGTEYYGNGRLGESDWAKLGCIGVVFVIVFFIYKSLFRYAFWLWSFAVLYQYGLGELSFLEALGVAALARVFGVLACRPRYMRRRWRHTTKLALYGYVLWLIVSLFMNPMPDIEEYLLALVLAIIA